MTNDHYLIDGYNLLHAMGVLHGRVGPSGLEKARLRLLGLVRGAFGDQAGQVTVVFDAAGAAAGVPEEQDRQGVHVLFAVHQDEADDLIEFLIGRDSAPRHLIVVSDDHRIQQAARRRQCTAMKCTEFLDEVDRLRRQHRARHPDSADKLDAVSRQEIEHWLREFADLADDPDLKELFDPYGFGEGGAG